MPGHSTHQSVITPDGVHVTVSGDGPVLLCLHGIGSSARSFEGLQARLADVRTVVAWDAPGYAKSSDPPTPPGMDGFADAAVAVLDHLEVDRADLLGVSFGGVVAVRAALRHPDRLRSIVLADSTPGSGSDPDRAASMRQRGPELARLGSQAFAAARAPRLVSRAASEELVARVADVMASTIRLPGYGWAADAMADTDHTPDLPRVSTPALVMCGAHDQICPPAVSRDLAERIPGARYAEVPGAGHLANQEAPDAFATAVRDFLGTVPA